MPSFVILLYTPRQRGAWVTFEDGAIRVAREIIVCQVDQVHFLSKKNPWFSSKCLRGGHRNGCREDELIHQRLAIIKEYFKGDTLYGFT